MPLQEYTRLHAGLIEEGEFLRNLDADLAELQARLVVYVREHGDAAKGAKASLTAKITLAVDKQHTEMVSIKTELSTKAPSRPSSFTFAQGDVDPVTGEAALFVRHTGSDGEHPAQGKLFTDKGLPITREEES